MSWSTAPLKTINRAWGRRAVFERDYDTHGISEIARYLGHAQRGAEIDSRQWEDDFRMIRNWILAPENGLEVNQNNFNCLLDQEFLKSIDHRISTTADFIQLGLELKLITLEEATIGSLLLGKKVAEVVSTDRAPQFKERARQFWNTLKDLRPIESAFRLPCESVVVLLS